jgi:hypothetical protein
MSLQSALIGFLLSRIIPERILACSPQTTVIIQTTAVATGTVSCSCIVVYTTLILSLRPPVDAACCRICWYHPRSRPFGRSQRRQATNPFILARSSGLVLWGRLLWVSYRLLVAFALPKPTSQSLFIATSPEASGQYALLFEQSHYL